VAVAASLLMTAGAASAATASPAHDGTTPATNSAMAGFRPGGTLPAGASIRAGTGTSTRVKISASVYCGTASKAWHGYEYGVLQWTLSMTTSFCYNYSTVVSHHTSLNVTYRYNWGWTEHSYTSTCPNGCRQNQQTVFGTFYWSAIYLAVDIHLQLTESYNGSWSWKVWTVTYRASLAG
jgi:hypothetical protein